MTEERIKELKAQVFIEFDSSEELADLFMNQDTLEENLCLHEIIMLEMLPVAQSKADFNVELYFMEVVKLLKKVIVQRLFGGEYTLYVLYQNNKLLVKEKCIYLTYTDQYKTMGKYEYKKVLNHEEFAAILKSSPANGVVITDGPNYYVRIDAIDCL